MKFVRFGDAVIHLDRVIYIEASPMRLYFYFDSKSNFQVFDLDNPDVMEFWDRFQVTEGEIFTI